GSEVFDFVVERDDTKRVLRPESTQTRFNSFLCLRDRSALHRTRAIQKNDDPLCRSRLFAEESRGHCGSESPTAGHRSYLPFNLYFQHQISIRKVTLRCQLHSILPHADRMRGRQDLFDVPACLDAEVESNRMQLRGASLEWRQEKI